MAADSVVAAFILAYHGCDRKVAGALVEGAPFKPSDNEYDWLGNGIYFWEANPKRALGWAKELTRPRPGRARIQNPAVVGAVIELGACLDLTTTSGVEQVRIAYDTLVASAKKAGDDLPENGPDLLRRNLDCAVIRNLHKIRSDEGQVPLDSVRGVFVEGEPIFPSSGFHAKTHIQVCVCNAARIKGVFRVPRRFLA